MKQRGGACWLTPASACSVLAREDWGKLPMQILQLNRDLHARSNSDDNSTTTTTTTATTSTST